MLYSSNTPHFWHHRYRACYKYNFHCIQGLCIKMGRGHRDVCVGTWDLGTRDEGLEDIKYGTRGCMGLGLRGRRDTGCG